MNSYETSPTYRKRRKKRLKREEDRWAAKSGPVEVTKVDLPKHTKK